MKNTHLLLPVCAALALSGCFMAQKSQIVRREVPYNAQEQARIRIYGQYGRDVVRMIPNSSCEQWAEKQGRRRHTRFGRYSDHRAQQHGEQRHRRRNPRIV